MPRNTTYQLLNFRFLIGSVFIVFLFLFLPFMTYIMIKTIGGFWNDDTKAGYTGLFLLLINIFLFYHLGTVLYLYLQYLIHDKNTRIEIDETDQTITIRKTGTFYILNSENIKYIEFHLSSKHYKNLLRNFEYTKFYSDNGNQFIITNFILDYKVVENMLESVKKIKRVNEINYLK